MKKRLFSLFCVFALVAGLLPATALAEDASWATDAVTTLNNIYGSGVFSADDTEMTEGDAASIAASAGWTTSKVTSGSTAQLSRSKACEVLADVFDLPIGSQSAIEYLYSKNIVTSNAPNNAVTKAEFSVLTYRVLNAVGGGMGSTIRLKPGTNEYFAWMYLAARGCVPFQSSQMNNGFYSVYLTGVGTNQVADSSGGLNGATLWEAWIGTLNGLQNVGWGDRNSWPQYPTKDTPLLEAVTSIVGAYIQKGGAETIFTDVPTSSPYYDGVMYLFDQGLVSGNGNGTFAPGQALSRLELAVLLARVDRYQLTEDEISDPLKAYEAYAQRNGYMTPPADGADAWWQETATREEAIVAIVKACANGTAVSKANTDVLDRFSDGNTVSDDAAPYIAYAVSIGILNGNQDGTLGLSTDATRGQAGVLLYRTLIGLDTSKMHDYALTAQNALGTGSTSTEP